MGLVGAPDSAFLMSSPQVMVIAVHGPHFGKKTLESRLPRPSKKPSFPMGALNIWGSGLQHMRTAPLTKLFINPTPQD